MVTYTKPQQRKKEESKRLRGERNKMTKSNQHGLSSTLFTKEIALSGHFCFEHNLRKSSVLS